MTLLRYQVNPTMEPKHGRLFIYWAVISVNILSFSAGVVFSWSSPTISKLSSNDTSINPLLQPTTVLENSWVTSILALGCIFGSITSSMASATFGRKNTLVMFSLPMLLCYILIAVARNVEVYYVARFLVGIGTGCVYSVLPIYVAEISEDGSRGFFSNFMGLSLRLGNAFPYIVGPFVSVRVFSVLQMVALGVVFLTFAPFVPDSPYYFIGVGDQGKAEESLGKLRGSTGPAAAKELGYITERVEATKSNAVSLSTALGSKASRRGLVVMVALMVIQQLSGVSAVIAYLQLIFESTGGGIAAELPPIIISFVQILSMFIPTLLVERLGRKPLLLVSSAAVSLTLAVLGTYYHLEASGFSWLPLVCIVAYFIFFNVGMASIPWTLNGELFPENVKTVATSISTCVCFVGAFIVTVVFPYMSLQLGMAGTFWVFAGGSALGFVFILAMAPETKGKSFAEIEVMLNK